MEKINEKRKQRDTVRAARIHNTALIVGVSARQVRRVLECESENDKVLSVFMSLQEGENELLKAVKKLVPFS